MNTLASRRSVLVGLCCSSLIGRGLQPAWRADSPPCPHCIRRGARPGCISLYDTTRAVPLKRWPPDLAKSPMPVAGWRGQMKRPGPGQARLESDIHGIQTCRSQFADWPPDRNAIPGTAAGTDRKRQRTVASATSSTVSCLGRSTLEAPYWASESRPPASRLVCKAG